MNANLENAGAGLSHLPRYLAALGLTPAAPAPGLLHAVLARHLASFPFASISVRLGDDMPLVLPGLFERVVDRRRGGYCFEQNGLLEAMLQGLGFKTRLVLARVIYDQDIHPGLTHRITLVTLDGVDQVVDAGFGPLGPRVPVPLAGQEQTDGWRRYRVAERNPGEFHLQLLKDSGWYSLYRFELQRYGDSDCELGHFYSHRHPAATFVNHLVVARLLEDRILSLRNRDYRIITAQGEQVSTVDSAEALLALLTEELGLAVTSAEAARLYEGIV